MKGYFFNVIQMSNNVCSDNNNKKLTKKVELKNFSISLLVSRNEESQRGMWKLNDISEVSEEAREGCVRAKFHLKSGPSKPATAAVQFICEGASLSGIDFELIGSGYRISLAKKRFGAGNKN